MSGGEGVGLCASISHQSGLVASEAAASGTSRAEPSVENLAISIIVA